MRRAKFFLILSILTLPIGGSADIKTDALRVCADPNYLPWSNEREEGFENRIASLIADKLSVPLKYTWFPQRMGFIRNTLRARRNSGEYKCDLVIGLPAGYELTLTTAPYYYSTYALVYIEGRGWDDIHSLADLLVLPPARRNTLRFGLAERNPGTLWLAKHGMLDRLDTAYASQHGDPQIRPGQLEADDLLANNIDFTIMWGPLVGDFRRDHPNNPIRIIPMESEPGVHMHFGISAGVRFAEKAFKEKIEKVLRNNASAVDMILREYQVLLVDESGSLR